MIRIQFIILALLGFQSVSSQKVIEKNFQSNFDRYGVNGCFVLFNPSDNEFIRYNPALCDTGYIPASTFKIPNSVIALEEGIIRDSNQVITWDRHEWPNKLWNQDQTLKTAIKYSCVWVYTGFAAQIGINTYRKYVNSFDYGNKNLSGPPTRFWLTGPFRISANQQIEFLIKFYHYDLPVSKNSIDIVKHLIILEQTGTYKISGKTGGGILGESEYIMWLVGYLEKRNKPYFFALNFKTADFNKLSPVRLELTKSILRELDLME